MPLQTSFMNKGHPSGHRNEPPLQVDAAPEPSGANSGHMRTNIAQAGSSLPAPAGRGELSWLQESDARC